MLTSVPVVGPVAVLVAMVLSWLTAEQLLAALDVLEGLYQIVLLLVVPVVAGFADAAEFVAELIIEQEKNIMYFF